jgi:hypothetical protein
MNDAPWHVIRRLEAREDQLEKELAEARAELAGSHEAARAVRNHADHLRKQLAAFVPPGTLSAGEIPALCGTCKKLSCVPGLPACARCVKAQMEQLAERASDEKLIRLAISDPGAFVKRQRFNDSDYETVPAWGARAVVVALREGRGDR